MHDGETMSDGATMHDKAIEGEARAETGAAATDDGVHQIGPDGHVRQDRTAAESEPEQAALPAVAEPGLSDAEIERLVAQGRTNAVETPTSRSIWQILRSHVCTLFNAIILVAMIMVLTTGSWRDAVFGLVIIINTAIGVVTELRAKITLDRLSILVSSKPMVRRGGRDLAIGHDDIVLGDLLWVRAGDQVPADGKVLHTWGLELDESMLTGESATVVKREGDTVLSGATAVSGMALVRVEAVGKHGYAAKLTAEAKVYKASVSDLKSGINTILKTMTVIVVPLCFALIWSQIHTVGGWQVALSTGAWRQAVIAAVAGVVGMIPEGLVLLTSLNFAIAAMRLARHKTLVQELESVETLARVDCLNLDKTGTITDGRIAMNGIEFLDGSDRKGDDGAVLSALYDLANEENPNGTGRAVLAYLGDRDVMPGDVAGRIPFSSARKWSAVVRDTGEAWYLGAPEVLMSAMGSASTPGSDGVETGASHASYDGKDVADQVARHADQGERVLMVARCPADPSQGEAQDDQARDVPGGKQSTAGQDPTVGEASMSLPSGARPVALVLCAEHIRDDASHTLAWFREQGVRCRVISGDNPVTVGAIARKVGLTGEREPRTMDARELPEDIDRLAEVLDRVDVLGRVLPKQKQSIVKALHQGDHVVAMTGDGVNDTLAIKEADLGIAMGNAAPAAKAVAQIILVDSQFSHLPDVVARGRQVMANMERVASLFLVKTIYSMLISIGVVLTAMPFPYLPRHITYIGALTIGMPAFLLALGPSSRRYIPGFLRRVVAFAIPGGAAIGLATLLNSWMLPPIMHWNLDHAADLTLLRSTNAVLIFVLAMLVLARVSRPLRSWRGLLVVVFAVAGVVGVCIPPVARFFAVIVPSGSMLVTTLVVLVLTLVVYAVCRVAALPWSRRVSHDRRHRRD